MKYFIKYILFVLLIYMLIGCGSGGVSPSASTCYGSGKPGCDKYWEGDKPRSVVIETKVDDDFVKKFHIPSKEKYINRGEVIVFRKWSKIGTSKLDKERALLECGSGDYIDDSDYTLMKKKSNEEYNYGLVMIKMCMRNDGYMYLGNFIDYGTNRYLSYNSSVNVRDFDRRINGKYCMENPSASACQPQPMDRILNSDKCRKYPKVYFCQPDWYTVDTCTRFPNSTDCKPED